MRERDLPDHIYITMDTHDDDDPILLCYRDVQEIPDDEVGNHVGTYTRVGVGKLKVTKELK